MTKTQKAIIDAHFEAKRTGKWASREVLSKEALIDALRSGETVRELYEEVEVRSASIGSIIMASHTIFGHLSENYKRSVRKTFTTVLTNLGII